MYLIHHGVKGQQWGVRNGPPYPIEDKVLRKGTRLNSVSGKYTTPTNYKNNGRPMYTYNPNDEWDSKIYKGPFSTYLVRDRKVPFLIDHEYVTTKDLKMPTRKQRVEEFRKLYNSGLKKRMISDLKDVQKVMVKYNVGSSDDMKKRVKELNLKDLKNEDDWKTAYEIFNHAMEASWFYKSTTEYMKKMSEKYDAMVDDNNQGVYNDAHDPIIIFKANEALDAIGMTFLSAVSINKNTDEVRAAMNKQGRRLVL